MPADCWELRGVRDAAVNFRLPLFTWGEAGRGGEGGCGAAACYSRSRASGVGSLHRRADDWTLANRRTPRDRFHS